MAIVLGECIKVSEFVSTITGLGTWNGSSGVYSVTLPSRGSCGGSGTGDQGVCKLKINACGQVKVTINGIGYTYSASGTTAVASVQSGPTIATMSAPGGGSPTDYCSTAALVGTASGTVNVSCETYILLVFGRNPYGGSDYGELNCTFTVEAFAW